MFAELVGRGPKTLVLGTFWQEIHGQEGVGATIMDAMSMLRIGGSASAGSAVSAGRLLDQCFPRESRAPQRKCPVSPRQIIVRITLAELFFGNIADRENRLPWRFEESLTSVLSRGNDLLQCLVSFRDRKALKVLAEPVFCMTSGTPAHARFVGGEFPTLSLGAKNSGRSAAMAVAFRRYGTDLEVTPRVLPDRALRLTVCVRQTCPDAKAGRRIGDVVLPELSATAAVADAEMSSGKTLLLYVPVQHTGEEAAAGLVVLATAALVRQNTATRLEAVI